MTVLCNIMNSGIQEKNCAADSQATYFVSRTTAEVAKILPGLLDCSL